MPLPAAVIPAFAAGVIVGASVPEIYDNARELNRKRKDRRDERKMKNAAKAKQRYIARNGYAPIYD